MFGLSIVIVTGIVGIGFCLLAARAIGQWQGWWRWAMAAPLLLMVGVVLNIVIAIWFDPTAHNLWPLEVLAWFVLASVAVSLLYLVHWFSHRVCCPASASEQGAWMTILSVYTNFIRLNKGGNDEYPICQVYQRHDVAPDHYPVNHATHVGKSELYHEKRQRSGRANRPDASRHLQSQ